MILLDTHALVWADDNSENLGTHARRLIDQAESEKTLCISAISFWECTALLRKGRLNLRLRPVEWRAQLLATGLIELPIDGEVAIVAAELDTPQGDPADRLIAATAIVHGATLVTADRQLLAWRHALKRQDARK